MASAPSKALAFVAIVLWACQREPATESLPLAATASALPERAGAGPRLSTTFETPPLTPPTLHAIGHPAAARDYRMTVLRVQACEVEPHFKPKSGHLKLGVEVTLEGLTSQEVPANPFLAKLRDGEQRSYPSNPAGCTPSLPAGRVTRGKTLTGFITFELPTTARNLELVYQPFVVGYGHEKLEFSLGR